MSTDSTIMLRRNFKHTIRNPVTVFNAVLFPIVLMLMFSTSYPIPKTSEHSLMSWVTRNVPNAPEPFACTTRSGMRSRF